MTFKPGDRVLIRKGLKPNDFVIGILCGISIWSTADGSTSPLWEVKYNYRVGRFTEESLKLLTDPNDIFKDIL